jgi:hypothetical protein
MSSNMLNMALFQKFRGRTLALTTLRRGAAPRCSVLHAITEDSRAAPAPHTRGWARGRSNWGEVPLSCLPQPGLVANYVVVCVVDLRTTSGSKV